MKQPTEGARFAHLSLRLPAELRHSLEQEAHLRSVNLNALATQILTKFVRFDRVAEHIGFVTLSRQLLAELVNAISAEMLERIGTELGRRVVKPAFRFFHVKADLANLVTHYFEPMGAYSGWFRFTYRVENFKHELVLQHTHGAAWTTFLRQYMAAMLEDVLRAKAIIEAEESTLTIKL